LVFGIPAMWAQALDFYDFPADGKTGGRGAFKDRQIDGVVIQFCCQTST